MQLSLIFIVLNTISQLITCERMVRTNLIRKQSPVPNPRQIATLPVRRNFADQQYIGRMSIGNPEQFFDILFDTGSADTWIPSKRCRVIGCVTHSKYDSTKQSSYLDVNDGELFEVNYGDGSKFTQGFLDSDSITIANLITKGQFFLKAIALEEQLFFSMVDGIVGLSYSSLSESGSPTPFDSMVNQKLIDSAVFGIHFNETGGGITFGGIDSRHFCGEITYANVTERAFWKIRQDSFRVGKDKSVSCRCGCDVNVDSGRPNIYMSMADFIATNTGLGFTRRKNSSVFDVDCSMIKNLPSMGLQTDTPA